MPTKHQEQSAQHNRQADKQQKNASGNSGNHGKADSHMRSQHSKTGEHEPTSQKNSPKTGSMKRDDWDNENR